MPTREEAMKNHPAGKARSATAVLELVEAPKSAYRAFFEALEELEMTIAVYGTSSTEADLARAMVRHCREDAAGAWRSQGATAA